MKPHTRGMVAAIAFAHLADRKVAGLYDHSTGRELRIAAECRGDRVQGFDGDRMARFGGTLPEIHDEADKTFVTFEVDGLAVRGYDRGTSTFYAVQVADHVAQVYDYSEGAWFAYHIQDAGSPDLTSKPVA